MIINTSLPHRLFFNKPKKKKSSSFRQKKDPFHSSDPKSFILIMLGLCFLFAMLAYFHQSFPTPPQPEEFPLFYP